MCGAAIRSNSRRTVCTVCQRGAHAACTELTREQIRREAYVWGECGAASGENGQHLERQQAPAVQTEETARCGVCGGYLRRGTGYAQCEKCPTRAHKKCAYTSRGQRVWRCGECRLPAADGGRVQPEAAIPRDPSKTRETWWRLCARSPQTKSAQMPGENEKE